MLVRGFVLSLLVCLCWLVVRVVVVCVVVVAGTVAVVAVAAVVVVDDVTVVDVVAPVGGNGVVDCCAVTAVPGKFFLRKIPISLSTSLLE